MARRLIRLDPKIGMIEADIRLDNLLVRDGYSILEANTTKTTDCGRINSLLPDPIYTAKVRHRVLR